MGMNGGTGTGWGESDTIARDTPRLIRSPSGKGKDFLYDPRVEAKWGFDDCSYTGSGCGYAITANLRDYNLPQSAETQNEGQE